MTKKAVSLMITDTHLKDGNDDLVFSIFSQAIDYCLKNKIKVIFHGGDIFTNRKGQTLLNLMTFMDILAYARSRGISIYAIPGNHDKTNQSSTNSYLDIFSEYDNFHCIKEEYSMSLKDCSVNFCFLPYFTDEEYLTRLLRLQEEIMDDSVENILITHKDINGVKNNDGSVVEGEIDKNFFKVFKRVLVGHYHNSQQFKNIFYIGSPYQGNFGETWEDKGFQVIYSDGSMQLIQTEFPKYIKLILPIEDKEGLHKEAMKYKNSTDFVRFVLTGKRSEYDKLNVSGIKEMGIDVRYESEEFNESISAVENDELIEFDKKTILREYLEYCELNKISGANKTFGLKILNKNL